MSDCIKQFEKYETILPYCLICGGNASKQFLRYKQYPIRESEEYRYICFSCCFDIKVAYDKERRKEKEKE